MKLLLVALLWALSGVASGEPRFVLLPLDNRPCNLLFVRQLARQAEAELVTPPVYWLGSFLNPGMCEHWPQWLAENVKAGDTVVVSSDMLCFGGLVASRNAATPADVALARLEILRALHERGARVEVLATVLRLSLRTSEGQAPYERQLAAWAGGLDEPPPQGLASGIPTPFVEEYLAVRRRNLQVVRRLEEMVGEGTIDQLVIGQDDSSGHGLHVHDQQEIRQRISQLHLEGKVTLLSGADELTMDMVSGRLADVYDCHPLLSVEYSEPGAEKLIPPLESHPLEEMVQQHLALCGARPPADAAEDVRIFIQVPSSKPFRMPEESERPQSDAFVERVREWMVRGHRAAIADLALINRMNPFLAQAVLERVPLTGLEGFAGWNTPANAFGTVVAHVVVRRIADRLARHWPIDRVKESERTHLSFLLARLIDDYGYQAIFRSEFYPAAHGLPSRPDPLLNPYVPLGREVRVSLIEWARHLYDARFLGHLVELPGERGPARLGDCRLEVILPWPRLFEVEVRLDVDLLPK